MAGPLFSTRCPVEAGLYERQNRVFTHSLKPRPSGERLALYAVYGLPGLWPMCKAATPPMKF